MNVLVRFVDSLQQEQPEAELEIAIDNYFRGWEDSPDYGQALNSEGECVSTHEIVDIARHFYELGKLSKQGKGDRTPKR